MELIEEIEKHKDSVYRQLIRACGGYEDAEDALIETMLEAYKAADQLRNPATLRSWLGTIASRTCSHLKRKVELTPILGLENIEAVSTSDPLNEAVQSQLKNCVADAISTLSEEEREVYLKREIQGRSANEVMEELGISLPALKSRLHRARVKVRSTLDSSVCAGMADTLA